MSCFANVIDRWTKNKQKRNCSTFVILHASLKVNIAATFDQFYYTLPFSSVYTCISLLCIMFPKHMCLFVCADEDDEGERNTVPFRPLASFFSDDDMLKQQKKKPKKIKEGKIPKVKKRKKEVRSRSHAAQSFITSDTTVWQVFWLKLCTTFFVSHTVTLLML